MDCHANFFKIYSQRQTKHAQIALNPAQPKTNPTQRKPNPHNIQNSNKTHKSQTTPPHKSPKTHTTQNSNKAPKKISLKAISHHQASAIVVKPRVIVAQKALSIELKAFVGKQLCAQSRTHHAFIALIFVF